MRAEPNSNDSSDVEDNATAGVKGSERRAVLFTVLSGLWIFPSMGAGWILWMGPGPWQTSLTVVQRLEALSIEQWFAVLLLFAHGLFIILALHFRHTEGSKETSSH